MDTVFSEHFARLQQQAERQVGQLSAICEMLDLAAAEWEQSHTLLLTKIFEVMLRHLGADGLFFLAAEKEEKPLLLPSQLEVNAAGTPPLERKEIQQIAALTSTQSNYPAIEQTSQLEKRIIFILPLEAGDYQPGFLTVHHHDRDFFTPDLFRFSKLLTNELTTILRLLEKQQRLLEETRGKERLCRFFSPEITNKILTAADQEKAGEEATVTILFADIRGFSHLSEQFQARQIVATLNCFYRIMTQIIFKHLGTLDKFAGDGLLALFGTPVHRTDDPVRAVAAAIEMQRQWRDHVSTLPQNAPRPSFAIGIHTGKVIAGFLGNDELLTFTVVGDPVNTCHRLVSLAPAGQIIISGDTKKSMEHQAGGSLPPSASVIPFRSAHNLRGMNKVIDLFQVVTDQS